MAIIFQDNFGTLVDGMVTNEYQYWNKQIPATVLWEMTSGSLFRRNKRGYSGIPISGFPNAQGIPNHSNVFRLNTKRKDFGDVKISMLLNVKGLSSNPETPPVDWDGVHIWFRYQSQYHLYYASISRRDGAIVFKKKVPVGPSNGGTYTNVSPYIQHPFPLNKDVRVRVEVKNLPDGSVSMKLYAAGTLILEAVDKNTGGVPPITQPGAVGVRGDNCEFEFDEFTVESL